MQSLFRSGVLSWSINATRVPYALVLQDFNDNGECERATESLETHFEHFRKSLSRRYFLRDDSSRSYRREGKRERERERGISAEMPLSKKENGIEGESERGHFVCLVPDGDTRCMGAAMRIIANAGTPLSDRQGRQE